MDRETAVALWKQVGVAGIVTGRTLEAFANAVEAAERERWRSALSYAVKEADGWFDESRCGRIETPEMEAARALLRA